MANWNFLNAHRVRRGQMASDASYGFNGAFTFKLPCDGRTLFVIASDGAGWRHVSVSFGAKDKHVPKWEIMCAVKDLFWDEEATVMQLHPPKSEYVSHHDGCLHLWEPIDQKIPRPPSILVGPK